MNILHSVLDTPLSTGLGCCLLLMVGACDYDLSQVPQPDLPPADAGRDAPVPDVYPGETPAPDRALGDQLSHEQSAPDQGTDAPAVDQLLPDVAPPDIKICPDLAAGACCPGATRACYPAATKGCVKKAGGYTCAGICEAGVETCKGGAWTACSGATTPQPLDPCNDLDDNCDGTKDEGFKLKGTPCTATKGKCVAQGTYVCDSVKNALVCSAKPVVTAEVCNNKDDDCDGTVDNGVCYSAWAEVKPHKAMDVFALAAGGKVVLVGGTPLKSNIGVIQRLVNGKPEAMLALSGGAKIVSLAMDGSKAVALASDGQVRWSTDSGANWNAGGKCAANNPSGIALSGNTVIVAAKGVICSSPNLGGTITTYTATDTITGKPATLTAAAVANIKVKTTTYVTALAVGYYPKPPQNQNAAILFRSFDGGKTWTQLVAKKVGMTPLADLTSPLYQDELRDDGSAVAAGYSDVFRSTDTGTTWKTQPVTSVTTALDSVSHDPVKGHMLVTTGYATYASIDDGKSFSLIADSDVTGSGVAPTVVVLDGQGNGYIGVKSSYGGGAKPGKLLHGKF